MEVINIMIKEKKDMQKLLSLISSHLFISAFVSLALEDLKKIIATIYIKECSANLLF